jgi:CheY-like chemotaxis protein
MSRDRSQIIHPPGEAGGSPKLRVLVADDYADAVDSLALVLTLAGFDVQIARDGEGARERVCAWHPHVCVLDLSMPKLDGCDLARWIREQSWPERPVLVALTGWGRADDQRRARAAGFDRHVTKPADPEELVKLLRADAAARRLPHG